MRAVIVDEAHLLTEEGRGSRLELLLGRLQRTTPEARLTLLSSQLPDVERLANWLRQRPGHEPAGAAPVHSDWRPTLLVRLVTWPDPANDLAYYQREDAECPERRLGLTPGSTPNLLSELASPSDSSGRLVQSAISARTVSVIFETVSRDTSVP